MNKIDQSDLLMWKQHNGRFMFQTNDPKLNRKMKGRNSFKLSGYSTNEALWVYFVDLPSMRDAKRRFKGICGREARYCKEKEIYY